MRRLYLITVMVLFVSACGKKGPLVYPDLLVPEAPAAVTVRQSGLGMKLSFQLPRKDRSGRPLADLAGVRVLKRETLPGQAEECSSCMDGFRLFKKLYVDLQEGSVRRYGNLIIMLDGDVTIDRTYTYTVVPFTKRGVDGQGSAQVMATMVEPPPPPLLRVIPSPTDIRLEFEGHHPAKGTLVG
jgi:predicted small lipoprotein YifL